MVRIKNRKPSSPKKILIRPKSIENKIEESSKIKISQSMNTTRRKSRPAKKLCKDNDGNSFFMLAKTYREIKKLQHTTSNVIPASPFMRLIREILAQFSSRDMRIQRLALQAIQEACELYMTQFFEDSYLATLHSSRATLMVKDMRLVRRIRGKDDILNR